MGGGLRAVGVGSGVTGFGANLIIIDDPVKSRAEAESQTYRDNLYNWFNDDIYTRLEPDGSIVLIQTRWHEDDLAGRLLRESQEEGAEKWEVISLPAVAELRNADCGLRIEETASVASTGGNASVNERALKDDAMQNKELQMENKSLLSPKGTNNIAQGKAEGRNPGYAAQHDPDPEGVEQSTEIENGQLRIDNEESTEHISSNYPLSIINSQLSTDPLNRQPGEALCRERFNEQKLDEIKRKLGSYSFAALYQQHPVPAEGGLFKRAWFKTINTPPPNLRWKRGYDLGISTNATADYTASLRIAFDRNGNMYIDGGYRARIEYPDQRRYILGRIQSEPDTEHGIELSANGHAVVQDLRREKFTQGRALRGVKVKGDKITRALPWIALAEEGKVFLVRAAWNEEFLDEAANFPSGTHDDQIDAVSIAVRMHRERSGRLFTF